MADLGLFLKQDTLGTSCAACDWLSLPQTPICFLSPPNVINLTRLCPKLAQVSLGAVVSPISDFAIVRSQKITISKLRPTHEEVESLDHLSWDSLNLRLDIW
ncbi:hypothetical protein O181_031848 [Austropuccinia psidii MF-1]|uniref:Uncharacterized protein n=1 Tax=Austropuccinia psidii MF-1 TaxID=1389203 RepID=A0A9Q3D0J1_9BASI|nr:hypothetical protein [Austropuccinia psidii MF-1]